MTGRLVSMVVVVLIAGSCSDDGGTTTQVPATTAGSTSEAVSTTSAVTTAPSTTVPDTSTAGTTTSTSMVTTTTSLEPPAPDPLELVADSARIRAVLDRLHRRIRAEEALIDPDVGPTCDPESGACALDTPEGRIGLLLAEIPPLATRHFEIASQIIDLDVPMCAPRSVAIDVDTDPEGLTGPAAWTLRSLVVAASECDWGLLGSLLDGVGPDLEEWRIQEAMGWSQLASLLATLSLPFAFVDEMWVAPDGDVTAGAFTWPAVEDPTWSRLSAATREAISWVYAEELVEGFEATDEFAGCHITIGMDGVVRRVTYTGGGEGTGFCRFDVSGDLAIDPPAHMRLVDGYRTSAEAIEVHITAWSPAVVVVDGTVFDSSAGGGREFVFATVDLEPGANDIAFGAAWPDGTWVSGVATVHRLEDLETTTGYLRIIEGDTVVIDEVPLGYGEFGVEELSDEIRRRVVPVDPDAGFIVLLGGLDVTPIVTEPFDLEDARRIWATGEVPEGTLYFRPPSNAPSEFSMIDGVVVQVEQWYSP